MTALATYPCDGTAGAAATTANTGFAVISGTIVYDSTGTAIEIAGGVTAYAEDDTAADYCAIWLSVPAIPTGTDECIAVAMNGATTLAAIRVRSTGAISIYSGLGTLIATTTAIISTGTTYRLEWNTRTDGQELRLYTVNGSTPIETLTGAVASALATNKRRLGHPQSAQAAATVDISKVTINDAWPNAANSAPIADAGPDQSNMAAGATVTLDGSGSSDPDSDPITYAWTQTAGDTVTLSSSTAAQPTFTAPSTSAAQVLTFSLIVTDSHGASSPADTVNVDVLAVPADSTILATYPCDGTPGGTVTIANSGFAIITGTVVYDSTGSAVEVADSSSSYVEDQTAGDYCAFWVSVPALPTGTDECIAAAMNGTTSLASVRITAAGTVAIYSGLGMLAATTTATITPGTQYRLEWNTRTDGQELRLYTSRGTTPVETLTGVVAAALATTKRRFGHPQTAQAAGVIDTFKVTINSAWPDESNFPPVADAGPDQGSVPAHATVTLDGSGSTDPDGDTLSYAWTQTAGDTVTLSSSTVAKPTFRAPSTGVVQTLTFSLTVTDSKGAESDPDTVNVIVLAALPAGNLSIHAGGSFVPAIAQVRINGAWVAASVSIIVGDNSVYSDTYADTY